MNNKTNTNNDTQNISSQMYTINGNSVSWGGNYIFTNDSPFPEIEQVIFNGNTTIVNWKDKTKTKSTCLSVDTFDPFVGFSICISKKLFVKLKGRQNIKKAIEIEEKRILKNVKNKKKAK